VKAFADPQMDCTRAVYLLPLARIYVRPGVINLGLESHDSRRGPAFEVNGISEELDTLHSTTKLEFIALSQDDWVADAMCYHGDVQD
jgi:hypothetical protein